MARSRRLRRLLARVSDMIAAVPESERTVRTPELRAFIRAHEGVPELRGLAFTMILTAEMLRGRERRERSGQQTG